MSFLQRTELVNIGNRDRQIRLVIGAISLAIGVILAAYFVVGGVAGWWRALVFIPFAVGLVEILAGRRGVCPTLAYKGQQNFDRPLALSGVEIVDRALANEIRQVGLTEIVQSLAGGAILTVIVMLIPA